MRAWIPFRNSFFYGLASVVAVGAISAQGQNSAGGQTRVIVRALANGTPVADLKAEELSIRTDGRQRQVKTLELVTVPAGSAADAPAAPPAAKVAAPFATTAGAVSAAAPAGTREFLILLDEESIAAGREDSVRRAVASLMADASPSDRFGLVSLRIGGPNVAPSTDRQAVTAALEKFIGGASTREEAGAVLCRAKRALESLTDTFRGSPAGRTLIVFSPGIVAVPGGIQRMAVSGGAAVAIGTEVVPELCQIRSNDFDELTNAANSSPANLYVVHYADGGTLGGVSEAQQGLQNLAGSTGGEFMRLVGGSESAVQRISKETASYYLATLDDTGGAPIRRVEARVSREGVKVHARPAGAGRPAPAAASAKSLTPPEMLTTTATFSQVPLRAAGFISREGTSDMKMRAVFEPVDLSVKLTAASIGVIDEKGVLKFRWSARPDELERSPVVAALPIKPGKYRVRVAATTATGGGTVDYDIDAALQQGAPLQFGGMMLGVTSGKGFAQKLQFTSADAMAVGVAEVYGVPKGGNLTVQFEILEGGSTEPRGRAAGVVQNGPAEDARIVIGGFDIGTLEPGDYVMRAIVSLDGKVAGTVARTLRKVSN